MLSVDTDNTPLLNIMSYKRGKYNQMPLVKECINYTCKQYYSLFMWSLGALNHNGINQGYIQVLIIITLKSIS